MKYRAILFDFDYTLGDSTAPIVESYTVALTAMGWPAPEREAVRYTVGYTLEDGYTMLTGDQDPEHRREFFRRFKAHAAGIMVQTTDLCPGAAELLGWLNESGISIGIVSTKGGDIIDGIFRHLGFRDRLKLIVGGQDVTRNKPDPEGLDLAVERLEVDKVRVLFCGDTVIDAETARRAGVDFCAVLNGTTPAQAFDEYPHVHIAPDLAELQSWLRDGE